jgi:hypothetical protein
MTSVCVLVELMYACACICVAEEEEGEEGMLVIVCDKYKRDRQVVAATSVASRPSLHSCHVSLHLSASLPPSRAGQACIQLIRTRTLETTRPDLI